jgi:hypothetical protein
MFFKRLNGKSQKDVVSALNVRIGESSPFFVSSRALPPERWVNFGARVIGAWVMKEE